MSAARNALIFRRRSMYTHARRGQTYRRLISDTRAFTQPTRKAVWKLSYKWTFVFFVFCSCFWWFESRLDPDLQENNPTFPNETQSANNVLIHHSRFKSFHSSVAFELCDFDLVDNNLDFFSFKLVCTDTPLYQVWGRQSATVQKIWDKQWSIAILWNTWP